ncbi:MAG: PD-(D/E)XK nuclease-like domain-containing protein [Rhodococcus sp. (in: high G+C Gram-positive bacteria)]
MTEFASEIVSAPGAYYGISDVDYHSDKRTLSSSGARKLLPPSTPAQFHYDREHQAAPKKHFDVGHAAHTLALGEGAQFVRIDADEWRSNAVKDQVAAVREEGKIPLKPSEYDAVRAMAEEILRHPIARTLFEDGRAEVSLYHLDAETGASLRTRPDWLTEVGGRTNIVDYKTAVSASPHHFAKSVDDYGYHVQDAWYTDAVRALEISDDPGFLFVVQSKTAPYPVNVFELDAEARTVGRELARRGIRTYAECTASGDWPAYPVDIHSISLPRWAASKYATEGIL